MSLLTDLDAFYLEHRRCCELEGDVSEAVGEAAVCMTCSCGGRLCRVVVRGRE